MRKLSNTSRKSRQSVAENEAFVTLVQVGQEDPEVRQQLTAILRLDNFNRKSALNTFIEQMRLKQAPKEFLSAIACLLDDAVAEKVLETITADVSGTNK
jgi:hypothetical protein